MASLPRQSLFLGSDSQPCFPFCIPWLIPCSEVWEMSVILQLSCWLLLCSPTCAALECSAEDRCCPGPCHNLSCPFSPTDCQTLQGLWNHFAYHTLCLHTPFNTIPHLLHLPGLLPQPVPWTHLVFHPFLHVICYLYVLSPLWDTSCFIFCALICVLVPISTEIPSHFCKHPWKPADLSL